MFDNNNQILQKNSEAATSGPITTNKAGFLKFYVWTKRISKPDPHTDYL